MLFYGQSPPEYREFLECKLRNRDLLDCFVFFLLFWFIFIWRPWFVLYIQLGWKFDWQGCSWRWFLCGVSLLVAKAYGLLGQEIAKLKGKGYVKKKRKWEKGGTKWWIQSWNSMVFFSDAVWDSSGVSRKSLSEDIKGIYELILVKIYFTF